MMSCASCGHDVAEEVQFCGRCGQRVGTKRCPYCAEEIQAAAVVCRFCQRDLGRQPATTPAVPFPSATPAAASPLSAANKPQKPLWAPGTPVRSKVMWAGVGVLGLAAVLFLVARPGWGFLLLWLGGALVLNRATPVLMVGGSLLGACVLLIPLMSVHVALDSRRKAAGEAAAKKAAQEQALRQVPGLEKELAANVAAGDWEAAAKTHERLKSVKPDHPALGESWSKIEPELQKLQARQAEERRHQNVAQGLGQARSVVGDKKLCDTPKAIADAWTQLKQVRHDDPEWSEAVAITFKLEGCRRGVEQSFSRGIQKIMIQQREQWAKSAETKMLDQGMNMDFILSGAAKERVTLKWALMSKAAVHKLTEGGAMRETALLGQLQKIGFKRVTFSDGFNESWYYDLKPPAETGGGKTVWEGMGITAPLALK